MVRPPEQLSSPLAAGRPRPLLLAFDHLFFNLPNKVTCRQPLLRSQMLRPAFSQYGARSLRLKILHKSSRGRDALSSTTFGTL